jgi:hypothetical protein
MSYILNALKKAEHERLREEPKDLDDFVSSGWDPYQKTSKQPARYWLPLSIVVIAAGLFFGFSKLNSPAQWGLSSPTPEPSKMGQPMPENIADKIATVENNSLENKPAVAIAKEQIVSQPIAETQVPLPTVSITGHIFIRSGSPLNRIFVGEKIYHVGDNIDRDWVIESIGIDTLTIRSGTLSTQLPLR